MKTPLASRGQLGALIVFGAAALGVIQFYRPSAIPRGAPFAHLSAAMEGRGLTAVPTRDALGRSGEVKVRFALPGQPVDFPLSVGATPKDTLRYQWVSILDTNAAAGEPRDLVADAPIAPTTPGFYRMAVIRDSSRTIVSEPTLAVMVPFERKLGQWLNGYHIGTYLAERLGGRHEAPAGFVEVRPELLNLPVSKHLKLSDFVTHDDQADVWPKYVALNPRLLDKLELVLADVGAHSHGPLELDVHSGFRAPAHNAQVRRSARDSRHQYGDAADVQIDANGDGKIDMTDEILVMLAVERVEQAHPDLVGGLGVYTSRRYRTPYLHIDTRGKRSRWHG